MLCGTEVSPSLVLCYEDSIVRRTAYSLQPLQTDQAATALMACASSVEGIVVREMDKAFACSTPHDDSRRLRNYS